MLLGRVDEFELLLGAGVAAGCEVPHELVRVARVRCRELLLSGVVSPLGFTSLGAFRGVDGDCNHRFISRELFASGVAPEVEEPLEGDSYVSLDWI